MENEKDIGKIENMNDIVDSILDYISLLHNVPYLELIDNSKYIAMYSKSPMQIKDNLFLQIKNIIRHTECSLKSLQVEIMSEIFTSNEIVNIINGIYENYKIKNQIGNDKIYYFEQKNINQSKMLDPRGRPFSNSNSKSNSEYDKEQKILNAPKHLSFSMKEFESNKTFDSLYGDTSRLIKNQVEFFKNNKEWYDSHGVPYNLGMMFVGYPGCGKTASIKAIANYTHRHVINVNFKNITTGTQLKNLFFNKEISILVNEYTNETKKITIPLNKRLYILEEIDAISNIVKKRTGTDTNTNTTTIDDELTLGEILTVFDGTLETPGRMIIITSNHPEYIDDALMRPGRIDLLVTFRKATKIDINEMYQSFYNNKIPSYLLNTISDYIFSLAEIQQVMLKYINSNDSYDKIIKELQEKEKEQEQQVKEQEQEKEQVNEQEKVKEPKQDVLTNSFSSPVEPLSESFLSHIKAKGVIIEENELGVNAIEDFNPLLADNVIFSSHDPNMIKTKDLKLTIHPKFLPKSW